MAGREVREYTNLSDPKDKKWGKGKDKIDDEDIAFQRMVAKMQEVAGERGGYLHGRGALDSDDLLYLKEQMEAEEDAERLRQRTEKRAFAAFKRAASLADSSPPIPLPLRVEPKPKSGIRQQVLLKNILEIKPKRQRVSGISSDFSDGIRTEAIRATSCPSSNISNGSQTAEATSGMHNHSILSPDAASDRFIAEFLLFMVQACTDEHEMAGRCNLLAEQLPKMSATLLEEALCWKDKQDVKELQYRATSKGNKDTTNAFFPSLGGYIVEDMPLVGLDAMERAKSTLEDFCRSYFMFHDVDVHELGSWFKYLPILTFVESYIYQLDGMNEEVLNPSREGSFSSRIIHKDVPNEQEMTDPFGPLRNALEVRGLMTERINKEFRNGVEYWTLERSLCNTASKGTEISIQDALRALQLKSFDYRVLNLLMYGLTKQQVNECHWDFLSVSEFLVEISDDLYDYEEDVLNNNFNILRMFVKVYKPFKAPTMMAKCIIEAEEKYQLLLNQLDPSLVSQFQKRCEEATKEGGKVSAHSLGSWSIPAVISNEECYRSQLQGSN